MPTEQIKDASFTDLQCAAIIVPGDRVPLYSMIKTEQLSVINRLVADQTAGYALELSENDVAMLASLAEELAHVTKHLVSVLTEDARMHKEGGE